MADELMITERSAGLHVHSWGGGDRVALLLHGQCGDGRCWWQVGPAIEARGYRVVAVDLPGHGRSAADPSCTLGSAADAVLDVAPAAPEVVMGHSLGGMILAHVVERMGAERAVYLDTPLRYERTATPEEVTASCRENKARRTLAGLRRDRPWWSEQDRVVEADAARRWDVATSVSLTSSLVGRDFTPPAAVPALVVRPEPSRSVPAGEVPRLEAAGIEVRSIPGAGHSVWYGYLDEFLAALAGWV